MSKKNDVCMELKNINYQSMLLKNKVAIDNTNKNTNNIEKILENELKKNKKKQWNKLSMTVKNNKIKNFITKYCMENKLNKKQKKIMDFFLKDALVNKKITRNKDVNYNLETGELISLVNMIFNSKTNHFTLKDKKKKKSILSGI